MSFAYPRREALSEEKQIPMAATNTKIGTDLQLNRPIGLAGRLFFACPNSGTPSRDNMNENFVQKIIDTKGVI
jgi:hypothetical protein